MAIVIPRVPRPELRDILSDLQERHKRIQSRVKARQVDHEAKVKALEDQFRLDIRELERERELLDGLIEIEARRLGKQSAANAGTGAAPTGALDDFFVKTIETTGPKSKDELRGLAEQAGYSLDGRSVHAVVMNITRGGRLRELEDGKYDLPQREREIPSLEDMLK